MRCICCDFILSDYESTRKHKKTGKFLDVCLSCLKEIHDMNRSRVFGTNVLENNTKEAENDDE